MAEGASMEAPDFPHLTDSGSAILKDVVARCVDKVIYDDRMPSGLGGLLMEIKRGYWVMFINPGHALAEQCVTMAHELGHLFLGHWPSQRLNPRRSLVDEERDKAQEAEADAYARRLLLLLSLQEEAVGGMNKGAVALI